MLLTEAIIIFILLDMFANAVALVLVAKKFDIFENIFLLHWKTSAMIQLFAILGLAVWFSFKTLWFVLPSIGEELEPSFLIIVVSFFLIGHVLLAGILLKGAPKVEP